MRSAIIAAALGAAVACSPLESEEARSLSYEKNVESCLCRSLEFETDSYSGRTYAGMQERCNDTVHAADPRRYPQDARAAPGIDALRCPVSVREWRETAR